MVEIVGCFTSHPGKAWPMVPLPPIRVCSEPDCSGKVKALGLCVNHYNRSRYIPASAVCPLCGPYETGASGAPICPTCDMTAGEHAYRARILADSDAVYAQEVREFNAKARQG